MGSVDFSSAKQAAAASGTSSVGMKGTQGKKLGSVQNLCVSDFEGAVEGAA